MKKGFIMTPYQSNVKKQLVLCLMNLRMAKLGLKPGVGLSNISQL